ncbi:heavy-metal-associated domain-containing protein [Alcaligenaceae bacterium SJ-26]|nr:heavy-metal-associated domain-containing protein [Alcaligenaceae bacterium SJ-26]
MSLKLSVPDMSCGHCVASITRAVQALDADARVEADLPVRQVTIDTAVAPDAVAAALREAGYENTPV